MTSKLTVLILFAALWAACGGPATQTESQPSVAAAPAAPVESLGEMMYKQHCRLCHMSEGQGIPGQNPPLAQTDWVNGDKERLIALTLNGMSGAIEVNGESYFGIMSPYAHLSDEQIAAVLTYIRSSFGNQAGPVTAAEVAAIRVSNQP